MRLAKIPLKKGTKVQYMSPELLFLAPSGQPHRGTVYVGFTSKGEGFDLVDFKQYITSLRTLTSYAENIAYEIFQTIEKNCNVKSLGVIVDLTARGGIQQRIQFGDDFEVVKKQIMFQV
jgi:NADPH-dependent 7-cyano-7-deazaguanine reductase QueF